MCIRDSSRAAALGKQYLTDHPGTIRVDNIGVGSGALSQLRGDSKTRKYASGFKFSQAASETGKFTNIKAESFWALREAFQNEEIAIAPLGAEAEETLMDELSGIMYEEMASQKIRIELKEKTIKRLGRSPNLADAVIYGFIKPKPKLKRQAVGASY